MDEMNQLKVFTAEEANQLLPHVTELLTELQATHQEILTKEVEIDALEVLYPPQDGNPSPEVEEEIEAYDERVQRFYELIDEIHGLGCFLKDLETGLIDFYAVYQGQVVYLCWKLGEPEVGYWHEVGRGYNYRQPLIQADEKESSG